MIQGYTAAIGDHAIDELDLFGMKGQWPVASIQFPAEPSGSFAMALSKILS